MRNFIQVVILAMALNFAVVLESVAATVCSSGADYTNGSSALRDLQPGGEVLFCRGEPHSVAGLYRLGNLQGAYVGAYGSGEIPTLHG